MRLSTPTLRRRCNSELGAEDRGGQSLFRTHWFMSLADAREKLESCRGDYNEVRPHSVIGYDVPADIHNYRGMASPPP
jgi:transposase InsO family protein